jgi:hypothetical protein
MKTFVAILLGLLSGLMVAAATAGLLGGPDPSGELTSLMTYLFTFLAALAVAWAVSAFWILHEAPKLSVVFRRGFLLGAAEWLAMIPVNLLSQAKLAASHAGSLSNAGALGFGIAAIAGVGFCVAMAIVCLVCFAVAYFIGREANGSTATKQCPLCAETIKVEARKCRFCNTDLPPGVPASNSTLNHGQQPSVATPVSIGKVLLGIGAVSCIFVGVAFLWAWRAAQESQRPKVVLTPEAERKYNEDIRKLVKEAQRKTSP